MRTSNKQQLKIWLLEALEQLGGSGTVIEVCRQVWLARESDLRAAGDLFYTWQYDIRWAAQVLRDEGLLVKAFGNRTARWQINR